MVTGGSQWCVRKGENFCVLNGNSGGNKTYAKDTSSLLCFNNIMIRCGDLKDPHIIVAGGLTYRDLRNSGEMKKRYEALGGQMQLVIPAGQGHTMWQGFFQCRELVDFVVRIAAPLRDEKEQREPILR